MIEAGEVVADRFVIDRRLGVGGMSAVYLARDRSGGLAAVKVLHGLEPDAIERFRREMDVLGRLRHPNIVKYIAHETTGARPFLAMQWIDGETLSDRLKKGGRMTAPEVVELGVAVAEALAAAHSLGVIHRDLKPANLMLPKGAPLSQVQLLDFGVARTDDQLGGVTQPGLLVGTPGYMAPEQVRASRILDARSDLFSLGCVLYACLTGHAPFRGAELVAVLAKIVLEPTPHVREERAG